MTPNVSQMENDATGAETTSAKSRERKRDMGLFGPHVFRISFTKHIKSDKSKQVLLYLGRDIIARIT